MEQHGGHGSEGGSNGRYSGQFRRMQDLPQAGVVQAGAPLCAGCGGLGALRQVLNVLGENTVVVNAAGCLTLLTVYPHSPLRGAWLYTAMGAAPAGAQGIRDALDILISQGRLAAEEDLRVLVVTGDGAAASIGLTATSGAIHRGLDFYYLCYDNEGFGNTGHQTSSTTPFGATTATRGGGNNTATADGVRGNHTVPKDLFAIWAAHRPAYLATLSAEAPLDLARKVERAMQLKGPRMFIAMAPCPTGWHFAPSQTAHVGQLALKTGVWPLKSWEDGVLTHTKPPQAAGKRPPVREYLAAQGRFAHLFEPQEQHETIARIQAGVDAYWDF